MVEVRPPQDRNGFKVAIICALPIEADGVQCILDKNWGLEEQRTYGKAPGDPNSYTTGVVGHHNVVLAHMPSMGSNSAASVAAGLRSSFQEIVIAFIVGICGAVPTSPDTNEEIILGDCIVSTTIFQYDFGAQYPGGFKRKNNVEDSLGRANSEIRAYLARLTTRKTRKHLITRLVYHLDQAQQEDTDLQRPSNDRDRLFQSTYEHVHREGSRVCNRCLPDVGTCKQECDQLGCEDKFLVTRQRLSAPETSLPRIHFGRYGTANTVMKSGERRDRINTEDDIIAFEMEGSGVWDSLPTIVVKSACDYADSHKSKEWQLYASVTAAAGMKAMLEQWDTSEQVISPTLDSLTLEDRPFPSMKTASPPALPPRMTLTPNRGLAAIMAPSSSRQWSQPSPASFSSYREYAQASEQSSAYGSSPARSQQPTPQQSGFFMPPPPSEEDKAEQNLELINAASKGDLNRVKDLHQHGADLNATNGPYLTPGPLVASATAWKQTQDAIRNPTLAYFRDQYRVTASQHWAVLNYLLNNGAKWDNLPIGDMRNEVQRALYAQAAQGKTP